MAESDARRPWIARHRLSVRFRDCDAMGHVNHAVYFTYLEQCRLTFWREATGAPHPHARVIIARAECDYRAPVHFGDEVEVRMRVGAIGRSSFTLEYEIALAGGGRLVASAKTVMVSYDYEAAKPVPLPDATRSLLERLGSGVNARVAGVGSTPKGSDPGLTPV